MTPQLAVALPDPFEVPGSGGGGQVTLPHPNRGNPALQRCRSVHPFIPDDVRATRRAELLPDCATELLESRRLLWRPLWQERGNHGLEVAVGRNHVAGAIDGPAHKGPPREAAGILQRPPCEAERPSTGDA